ncbi:hypothetical protein C8R47DRAFT_983086 [Mycena vitilis]|nr:hypothetical protein C8R47DRAFT_983086 [Mycena vitilis]
MCPDSCIAYTGPWAELEVCTKCGKSRWDPIRLESSGGETKVAARKFETIPIGPVLQALWRSKESAKRMGHRQRRTAEIRAQRTDDGKIRIDTYDDIYHGKEYLTLVEDGTLTDDDSLLMFSIDGAQLYAMKQSDCWI